MSDLPENLVPAQRDDLIAKLAFALTRDRRLARMQSAELPASIVAERIVERLEASGYVVMRGAGAGRGSARPRSSAPMMLRWLPGRPDPLGVRDEIDPHLRFVGKADLLSHFICSDGGRTRARTLDPLIKRKRVFLIIGDH
jgi:hypothetical protein